MVIDSQAAFAVCMGLVTLAYFAVWFVNDRWFVDQEDKAFWLMLIWMVIGWFPMGVLGFGIGLVAGYFSGILNEFTTGGLLTGMALYIPVGILGYHLHNRHWGY